MIYTNHNIGIPNFSNSDFLVKGILLYNILYYKDLRFPFARELKLEINLLLQNTNIFKICQKNNLLLYIKAIVKESLL